MQTLQNSADLYKHNSYRGITVVPRAAEFNSGSWDLVSGNRRLQEFKIWYHYKCAQIHYRSEILNKYIFVLFCFTMEVYLWDSCGAFQNAR